MLFSMSIERLGFISAAGGVAALTTLFYIRRKATKEISQQTFYLEAVEKLKSHEGAKYLLGTPIITKKFDITNTEENILSGPQRRICFPVGGSSGKGVCYIKAVCSPDCVLSGLELEIKETAKLEPEKYLGKRLIIVKEESASS